MANGKTQAVYYRDSDGNEPVFDWVKDLAARQPLAAAKINLYIDQHLNGKDSEAPPAPYPFTSEVDRKMRELRIRFANDNYRLLYHRSDNLFVLLQAFRKDTKTLPTKHLELATRRFDDFRVRMGAKPRVPPRAAGRDAPITAR
jgi:phage-related protein